MDSAASSRESRNLIHQLSTICTSFYFTPFSSTKRSMSHDHSSIRRFIHEFPSSSIYIYVCRQVHIYIYNVIETWSRAMALTTHAWRDLHSSHTYIFTIRKREREREREEERVIVESHRHSKSETTKHARYAIAKSKRERCMTERSLGRLVWPLVGVMHVYMRSGRERSNDHWQGARVWSYAGINGVCSFKTGRLLVIDINSVLHHKCGLLTWYAIEKKN